MDEVAAAWTRHTHTKEILLVLMVCIVPLPL